MGRRNKRPASRQIRARFQPLTSNYRQFGAAFAPWVYREGIKKVREAVRQNIAGGCEAAISGWFDSGLSNDV
jgi:hypothetical protein